LKEEFRRIVLWKLVGENREEQDYAFRYIAPWLNECFDRPPPGLVRCVNAGLKAGDKRFKELVSAWCYEAFDEREPEHPWRQPFADTLSAFVEAQDTAEESTSSGDPIPF
jgi:hypothetical protein